MKEIPDRREIAEAYSKGIMMIDAFPDMKEAFKTLYSKIEKLIF